MKNKLSSLIFITALLVSCGGNKDDETEKKEIIRPVMTFTVPELSKSVSRHYPGISSPVNNANIAFEVSGKITELDADVGKKVKKGDLLAKLDERDFKNTLDRAMSERTRAKAHYERIKNAAKADAVSKQDLTNALAAYEAAEASLKIAKKALDDASIYAPFDGEIVTKYVEKFENISPKQPIIKIVDDSKMEMTVDLPERMRLAIKDVTNVWVSLDAFPNKRFPAIIYNVGSEPSKATGTYPITVRFDKDKDLDFIPGMVGEVGGLAKLDEQDFFASVPALSLFPIDEDVYVYRLSEIENGVGVLKKTKVTPFNRFPLENDGVPVRGLKPNDIIVSAGVSSVNEGQKVRILREESNEK